MSLFENRPAMSMLTRQILSYTLLSVQKDHYFSKWAIIRTLFHRTDTHHFNPLYPCEIIIKQLYLISLTKTITCAYKYSQNYDFYIFYFVSLEVGTAALKIFCVMIPSLVDTSLDFEASIPFTRCRCRRRRDVPILYTVYGLIISRFYYYRPTYFTAIYIQVDGILKYRRNVSW